MRVLGIDPGLDGAAAVFDDRRLGYVEVFDLETVGEDTKRILNVTTLSRWVEARMPYDERVEHEHHAYLEYVNSNPAWGTGSVFRFGMSFGQLRATVELCGIPQTLVVARKWRPTYNIGNDKKAGLKKAIALFPNAADKFARVKDEHRADAALIAYYGYRILKGARGAA